MTPCLVTSINQGDTRRRMAITHPTHPELVDTHTLAYFPTCPQVRSTMIHAHKACTNTGVLQSVDGLDDIASGEIYTPTSKSVF
mmetsp:Transcript_20888/g.58085  ORF Transcript_20888/g.58085 Transcript_20888/m.58085 type:complete len:84 (+) Transcript_20888:596-847(+)